MKLFGLIGRQLQHSCSVELFSEIFTLEGIKETAYSLYPLRDVSEFQALLINTPGLLGLNVTVPFKKTIMPLLDDISPLAKSIGAVNVIAVRREEEIPHCKGYNTDVWGFKHALRPLLGSHHRKALILGSGGAAAAARHVLRELNIESLIVSRKKKADTISFDEIAPGIMASHLLIIQATPLGMFPETHSCPPIPYQFITPEHLLFDMVYNPAETLFMQKGAAMGAMVCNGMEMLRLQAQRSWQIWKSSLSSV
ncbi:MAG: shikimate dehydrogenase family protein [Flavobacteriales bacterium]